MFDKQIDRILEATQLNTIQELTQLLGISRQALSQAKNKGKVPKTWLKTLERKSGLNPDWVLSGDGPTTVTERYKKTGDVLYLVRDALMDMVLEFSENYGVSSKESKLANQLLSKTDSLRSLIDERAFKDCNQLPKEERLRLIYQQRGKRSHPLQSPSTTTPPRNTDLARNAHGKETGYLISENWIGEFQHEDEFRDECGIAQEDWNDYLASRRPPSWDDLIKFAKTGCNINFLLLGKGHGNEDWAHVHPYKYPNREIERVMLAIGIKPHDPWKLARALEIDPYDAEQYLIEAKKDGHKIPHKYKHKLQQKFGINPAWISSGEYPSHVKQEDDVDTLKARIKELEAMISVLTGEGKGEAPRNNGTDGS